MIPTVAILLSNRSTTAAELRACALRLTGDLQLPAYLQLTSLGDELVDLAKLIDLDPIQLLKEEEEEMFLMSDEEGDEVMDLYMMMMMMMMGMG